MGDTKKLTMDSRLGEVYASPVGHDALGKVLLQLNIPEKVLQSGVVANLKLRHLYKLTGKMVNREFFESLLQLLNTETDIPAFGDGPVTKKWWKEAVFYQIYPRSFYDANGDGMGDLRGIIEKLDYLQELGVTALWLSPIYDSPNDDNGYDIRDYHKIMKEFGTMEDFEELLAKVHEKGMRLIMDLVVNHTSDEHEWFQQAIKDKDSKYRNYYFFREDEEGMQPPNNWTSFFAGSAWKYFEEEKLWALHLFSKKQMDLNWDNPDVREDVIRMVNWWLDKGVDGFRMDVINYISKTEGLPQGDESIGKLMGFPGIEKYYYGPRLHEYLREIREKAFEPHDAFSVGETPGVGMKMSQLLTGEERKELDMVFSFDHLETPGHVRFDDYRYDLNYYRDYMIDWMEHYGNHCWMSIFYNNHDNPRMISKINPDPKYRVALAALLAVMQFTLKGTPFMFQGDEMGLENYPFTSMDQISDVEAKGVYLELLEKKNPEEAFATILAGTREHTRILLPWNEKVKEFPRELQQEASQEVFEIYRELIALRKREDALVYGKFVVLNKEKNRFVYGRKSGNTEFIIDCNLSDKKKKAFVSKGQYELVFPKHLAEDTEEKGFVDCMKRQEILQPYEARIWRRIV